MPCSAADSMHKWMPRCRHHMHSVAVLRRVTVDRQRRERTLCRTDRHPPLTLTRICTHLTCDNCTTCSALCCARPEGALPMAAQCLHASARRSGL